MIEAAALELLVTDSEHLVDEEHVRLHVHGDREAETHVHAAGVVLHRVVDELPQAREVDDGVGRLSDFPLAKAQDRAVERDVLPARHVWVESGT